MSRLPRDQEHLKSGFLSEAASAARYRAYATRAERDGLPNLSQAWRELAAEKDELAISQLEAAGQVRGGASDLREALGEERFENEVLYPKLTRDSGAAAAGVFARVIEAQARHLDRLELLRDALQASRGDVEPAQLTPEPERSAASR